MKIIIDVPEDVIERARKFQEIFPEAPYVLNEIAKGVPYEERPQKVVTIPHELIEKLVLCVVNTVENIDWDKAIEAYKERPTGEWIPVSERLPDDGEEVLTCRNGGFREIQSFEHGDYWENQNGDCTDVDEDEVIAWQPLPEPYKEGGEEE